MLFAQKEQPERKLIVGFVNEIAHLWNLEQFPGILVVAMEGNVHALDIDRAISGFSVKRPSTEAAADTSPAITSFLEIVTITGSKSSKSIATSSPLLAYPHGKLHRDSMWHNFCLFRPMLAFAERHVGDFANAGAIVVNRADMAPSHILGAVSEVVGTVRHQPPHHRVDFVLGCYEGLQRGVGGLGHNGPRVGFADMTALAGPEVKFNRTRNVPRTSGHCPVAWVLHGRNRNQCKPLESRRNVSFCVANAKSAPWEALRRLKSLIRLDILVAGTGFEPVTFRL